MNLNRSEAARLLEYDDTFATTLMVILLSEYGDEVFTEDPIVIFKNLEDDFRCKLSEETETRINAALMAMTTDLAYVSPHVFKAVALAFTDGDIGGIPDGEEEELDGSAALWTVVELGILNDDGEDSFDKFSPSIQEMVYKLVKSTAADPEELPDDPEELFDASLPFHELRIREDIKELQTQLLAIGADEEAVASLSAAMPF